MVMAIGTVTGNGLMCSINRRQNVNDDNTNKDLCVTVNVECLQYSGSRPPVSALSGFGSDS